MTTPEPPCPPAPPLLGALPHPCLLVDAGDGGRVRHANPAAARYFGVELSALAGRALPGLFPELAAHAGEALEAVRAGGETRMVTLRAPGPWAWVGARLYPVGDLVAVQFFDVTEHRAAETRAAALLDLTQALSRALTAEEAADTVLRRGLAALGAQTGSVFVLDEAGEDLTLAGFVGYDAAYMAGWQRFPVATPTPLGDALRAREGLFLGTAEIEARYPHLRVQRTVPVRAVAALPLLFGGRPVGVIHFGFAGDQGHAAPERLFLLALAEQLAQALERTRLFARGRRALAAAEASEARYRALIEATAQYVWTNSPEGEMVGEQPGWARLTGQTPDEYRGYGWSARLHPDDRDGAVSAWHEALRTRSLYEVEQRVQVRDGSYRSFLVRAVPRLGENGRLREWIGLHSDVTALKQAERTLQAWGSELERQVAAQTRELRAANEELGAFAYTVSHDLRAPVRHVGSFAGLLRKKVGDDPGVLRYVDVIEGAARRMETLTDALLGLARAGTAELHTADVDLGLLVNAARSDLGPDLAGRDVAWQVGGLPVVRADAGLLRQVLANLLGNAVKYSRERADALIEVWAEETAGEVVVAVRDNGAGFDPRYAGKLFGVFQRLHHQHEFEGTGVGLANVRRIVERHGGRVWAEGQPGAGATFFFSLPRR